MDKLTQEQINEITQMFKRVFNEIKKIIEPVVKWFLEFIGPILRQIYYYKKYNRIYIQTKSGRIKKKQMTLLRKQVRCVNTAVMITLIICITLITLVGMTKDNNKNNK